jgi:hypothetical protein
MSLFSNTHAKRRTGYMVLLAWVLALAAGWANACLLQERGTHWQGHSHDATLVDQAAHFSPGHAGVDSDHAENSNSGAGQSASLKVCDDDKQAVVKLVSSVDLTPVTLAPPTAIGWPDPAATARRRFARWASPAPTPVVPLRTLFVRLAL